MFVIKVANLHIGIRTRYQETEEYCREYIVHEYIVQKKDPDFIVEPTEKEIDEEMHRTPVITDPGEAEFICVYRQIGYRLLSYDAMIMHAAVLDVNGIGIALLAPSGTGKTTLALHILDRYDGKARIINGDKPILRFEEDTEADSSHSAHTHGGQYGKLYAYGTPWNGKEEFGCNDRVQLRKVCFLERAQEDAVSELSEEETAPLLFRQLLIPSETEQVIRFFDLVERIMDSVECYQIRCTQNESAADAAIKEMRL